MIDSDKFSTIERLHHLKRLKDAICFKIRLLEEQGIKEDRKETNFDDLIPEAIEYEYGEPVLGKRDLDDSQQHQLIVIALKKDSKGVFSLI